jgi:hypothetical protein
VGFKTHYTQIQHTKQSLRIRYNKLSKNFSLAGTSLMTKSRTLIEKSESGFANILQAARSWHIAMQAELEESSLPGAMMGFKYGDSIYVEASEGVGSPMLLVENSNAQVPRWDHCQSYHPLTLAPGTGWSTWLRNEAQLNFADIRYTDIDTPAGTSIAGSLSQPLNILLPQTIIPVWNFLSSLNLQMGRAFEQVNSPPCVISS